MVMWKHSWSVGGSLTTAGAIRYTLMECDDGVAENAMLTAENTANALGDLAQALEDKGIFTSGEIREIFQLYGFDEAGG